MTSSEIDILSDGTEGEQESQKKRKISKKTLNILRAVILVGVIALTVVLVLNREKIQGLKAYGYPGIFLFSILANATILIPVPGVVFTSAMGAIFNPCWCPFLQVLAQRLVSFQDIWRDSAARLWLRILSVMKKWCVGCANMVM